MPAFEAFSYKTLVNCYCQFSFCVSKIFKGGKLKLERAAAGADSMAVAWGFVS